MSRAVVLVCGGDATSPFTTPTAAAASGLAAGNTHTALREYLIAHGHQVYTAPAQNGRGPVTDSSPSDFGAFAGQPEILDERLTINTVADIDLAGEHLAHFIALLHERYGIDELDLIGHSNGGLFARSAIRVLAHAGSLVRVRSLTTLGTPWMGSLPIRWALGEIPDEALMHQEFATRMAVGLKEHIADSDQGLAPENTYHYLVGPHGWNDFQIGVLDDIPVYTVGGRYFEADGGDPELWSNDGLVTCFSATAQGLPAAVAPRRRAASFHVTHSIYVSNLMGLPWETGMTWNRDVLASVEEFLRNPQDYVT